MLLAQNLSKVYHLYTRPSHRIIESLPFISKPLHTDFWALRDVSFRIEKGEVLGIVGPNGSGKSTLLQIVSGILQPTQGRVVTEGRVSALLELGAGFNLEFTGRENVYVNGEIMGLSRSEMDRAFPHIEKFAEIGEFMDRPVKEYSSGMYVRLAFATAIHVDPDILVVDEALAVGDAIFANRCIKQFEALRRRGVTVLLVSHDLGLVKRLAHKAIFLVNGAVQAEGRPSEVVNRYVGMVLERQHAAEAVSERASDTLESAYRHGDRASEVVSVELLDSLGKPCSCVQSGELVTVRVRARFNEEVANPVVGVLIRNRLGIDVFGTNTRLERKELGKFAAGDLLEAEFRFPCDLTRQDYTLTVATQHWDGSSQDWLDDVLSFSVIDEKGATGLVNFATEVEWRRC